MADIYRAEPNAAPRGLILVAHEIFGLTPHIMAVCDRLAETGLVAVAPNLFRAANGGRYLPYTEQGKTEGLRLKDQITDDGLLAILAGAFAAERSDLPRFALGFCLGGTLAWMAATSLDLDAAIAYYAVGLRRHIDRTPRCPVLMHFGLTDPNVPQSEVAAFAGAHPEVEVCRYAAGHAFNRDDDKGYAPDAAAEAWTRTMAFLTTNMGLRRGDR